MPHNNSTRYSTVQYSIEDGAGTAYRTGAGADAKFLQKLTCGIKSARLATYVTRYTNACAFTYINILCSAVS